MPSIDIEDETKILKWNHDLNPLFLQRTCKKKRMHEDRRRQISRKYVCISKQFKMFKRECNTLTASNRHKT